MKFNGEYKNGVFVPDESVKRQYKSLILRSEREKMKVSIDINKAERVSDSQVGLFWKVVQLVTEATGSDEKEVVGSLHQLKPFNEGKLRKKTIGEMDTKELSLFIERSIMFLQTEFNLQIDLTTLPSSGQTRIIVKDVRN